MSKLALLVLFVCLLASTFAAKKVTNDPIPISDIPDSWYMIPVKPNKQGTSLYGDGTSTAVDVKDSGIVGYIISTIYSYTLGPIVDIFMSIVSTVIEPFKYVGSFIGLTDPPPEKSRIKRQVDSTEVETVPFNNVNDTGLISVQFFQNIYQYLMSWIITLIYGTMESLDDASSGTRSELGASGSNNELELMDNIMDIVQDITAKISLRLWDFVKSDLVPFLDSLIDEFKDSDMFSDDVKEIMNSLHAAYQMAHLLNIV